MLERHMKKDELPDTLPCLAEGCDKMYGGKGRWRNFLRHSRGHLEAAQDRNEVVAFEPAEAFIRWALEKGSIKFNGRYYELNLSYTTGWISELGFLPR
jgi:hypothetical protein